MNWYLAVLKKYAVFSGRARRKEYWMYCLFTMIFTVVLGIVEGALGIPFLSIIYALATCVPTIAVLVRRLHDTGRTGWWALIGLVPLVGPIVLLVFTVFDGEKGSNQYGSDPKEHDAINAPHATAA